MDVIVRLLEPVLMLEVLSPLRFKVPESAVRFKAPVVIVKPLEAVNVPLEVMVPVLVVEILPEVERVPASVIASLVFPPDWISKAV